MTTLKTWLRQRRGRTRWLAERLDKSPTYIWQVAAGWKGRRPSPALAKRIEQITEGQVTCEVMRPDATWLRNKAGEIIGWEVA